MTKQEFKNVTKDCFKNYGFRLKNNHFFLDLDELIIVVDLMKSNFGEYYYINFNFRIHALHENEPYFGGSLIANYKNFELIGDPHLHIFLTTNPELHYEGLSANEYKEALNAFLVRYFGPIKEKGLKYIKTFVDNKKYVNYVFTEQAKEFLRNC